jgi:NAD(P)-dependent dehydrogenase (short-subunit alcohol dehydrogenase family)
VRSVTSETVASTLLRPGLLEGVSILLAGGELASPGSTLAAVNDACSGLGARVSVLDPVGAVAAEGEQEAIDQAVARALAEAGSLELLVIDGGRLFAAAAGEKDRARAALRACLDMSWNVTRAVVNQAFQARGAGGRILYLAPPPGAGEHAEAARAGLENLARTLSVEWARHAVTVAAIAPGEDSGGEVAALTAYLASPAGDYFSGCLLDLRGPARR